MTPSRSKNTAFFSLVSHLYAKICCRSTHSFYIVTNFIKPNKTKKNLMQISASGHDYCYSVIRGLSTGSATSAASFIAISGCCTVLPHLRNTK